MASNSLSSIRPPADTVRSSTEGGRGPGPLRLVLAALLLAACAAPGPRLPDRVTFDDWSSLAPGWEKLDRIDRWLSLNGPGAPSEQRLEALLDLAEGRTALASLDRDTVDGGIIETRLQLAALGFRTVLTDRLASAHQRYRAEEGLAAVEQLGFDLDGVGGFQDKAGRIDASYLPGDVVTRTRWSAAPADRSNMRPSSTWEKITIHHTAMDAAHLRGGSLAASADEIRGIQRQHQRANGWADVGYHFLIDPSGRVFQGRDLAWQGAHAGRHPVSGANFNAGNLGVCLLGNFDHERPTPAALSALDGLVDDLRARFGISRSAVFGHRHFKVTACPGTHLAAWLQRYKAGFAMSSSPGLGSQRSATGLAGSAGRTRTGSSSVR